MLKLILINKNKALVTAVKNIKSSLSNYLLKIDYQGDQLIINGRLINLQTNIDQTNLALDNYKISNDLKIQDLYNKYNSLLSLINLDEETLEKLKEAIDLINSENLVVRLEKIENIGIGSLSGTTGDYLKNIGRITFKDNELLVSLIGSSQDQSLEIEIDAKYGQNFLALDQIYNENDALSPNLKVENINQLDNFIDGHDYEETISQKNNYETGVKNGNN